MISTLASPRPTTHRLHCFRIIALFVGLTWLLPSWSGAQVLTQEQYLAGLQNSFINHRDSLLPTNYEATGTDINWDFSTDNAPPDTTWGQNRILDGWPYTDSFPTANYVTRTIDSTITYYYYRKEANTVIILGSATEHQDSRIEYSIHHPGFVMQFPITLGSTWSFPDTMPFDAMIGNVRVAGHCTGVCSATGTIHTPSGNRDVLTVSFTGTGTFVYCGFTIHVYRYWVLAFDTALGQVAMWDSTYGTGSPMGPITRLHRCYSIPLSQDVAGSFISSPTAMNVWPNPAQTSITIDLPKRDGYLRLFDPMGREALQINAGGRMEIPVGKYSPGLYTVVWGNGTKTISKQVIIQK